MAVAHSELLRQVGHSVSVQGAGPDAIGRDVRESRYRVDLRAPRRQLGPAAQTRPEPRALGGRRRVKEAPVIGTGYP